MTTQAILLLASASLAVLHQAMAALALQKQNSEMTAEEEAQYDELVTQQMTQPHWRKSTG